MSIYFFDPIPRYTIWGGTSCNENFGYTDKFDYGVGQVWAFSAQDQDSTVCMTAPYEGMTLKEMWETHEEIFGNNEGIFPLLISLVGPEDHLSIQIHPDTEHAKKLGFPTGKNEAWYFINTRENGNITYGCNAGSEEEVRRMIAEDRWEEIPKYLPVYPGKFVYVPAGLMHAVRAGNVVYEIQQATDVTYRFYDYKRKDQNGNERKLNLEEAIDCMKFEPGLDKNDIHPVVEQKDNLEITTFIRNESFTVTRLVITGDSLYSTKPYQLASVVLGKGTADGTPVKVGDNFLISAGSEVALTGNMTILMTTTERDI